MSDNPGAQDESLPNWHHYSQQVDGLSGGGGGGENYRTNDQIAVMSFFTLTPQILPQWKNREYHYKIILLPPMGDGPG